MHRSLWLFIAICGSAVQAAEIDAFKHLGVASCASATCHGKTAAQPDRHVGLNEYRTWLQEDLHSRAYKTLETARSRTIASKLGIANPASAKICLDCHADNVPAAKRGPKFQLSDGVSCEACHGGAERWIESHATTTATHKANLAAGMYPSELPQQRARLCLSCHLGARDRIATHSIMAAGHPRLMFEMEAFTANQPTHHVVDADYVDRKGRIEAVNLWLAGQFENAQRLLALLQTDLSRPQAMLPELAFYDCHSCHHSLKEIRWTRERAGDGVLPGTLRLQTHSLIVVQAVAEALGDADAAKLGVARQGLVRSGISSVAAVKDAAKPLQDWLNARQGWLSRNFSRQEATRIRRTLVEYSAADRASDYGTAEQMVLGAESLSHALGDQAKLKAALDVLYGAVKNDAAFDPGRFAAAARSVVRQF
jgi:hypothetical protein